MGLKVVVGSNLGRQEITAELLEREGYELIRLPAFEPGVHPPSRPPRSKSTSGMPTRSCARSALRA